MKFKKIAIVGMGLMGGSLGFVLLRKKMSTQVVGLGRNIKRLNLAKANKAATLVTLDVEEAITGADLVVIALPVMLIPGAFNDIRPYLSKNAIVTDMGSVKSAIVGRIAKLDVNQNFIGSHPMVGSEKAGIENIKKDLYENGTCIVTPDKRSDRKKTAAIVKFWKAVGMNVIKMNPKEHDKCAAAISHFPHLAAFAMVVSRADEISRNKKTIGPGFKDFTRIAASNEELWSEIMIMNKNEILGNVSSFIRHLKMVSKMIENGKIKELKSYIKKSRILRESIK
jgi:prephenate dehydrogenase